MLQGQVGGKLGPFTDPATGQPAMGNVHGTFNYQVPGDPSQILPRLQHGLLSAINQVVAHKLMAGQVAIPTLQASLPHFSGEIIAQSGAQGLGAHVANLQLHVNIQQPGAAAAYTGPMPPTPMEATAQALQENLDPRNYDYGVQVNVGGFKLNASTDEGFDAAGLKNQVTERVKSTVIWYAVFGVAVLLVLLVVAGVLWYAYGETKKAMGGPQSAESDGKAEVVKWDGKTPFSCGASKHVRIEGAKADLKSGTAISATASCRVELVQCDIKAPTAISAIGAAVVTVQGGKIEGTTEAAKAVGNAQIIFKGTKVVGKTNSVGQGAKITGP